MAKAGTAATVRFRGSPERLTGSAPLPSGGPLNLDVRLDLPEELGGSAPVYAQPLAADIGALAWLRLSLPTSTPPGTYGGTIRLGERPHKVAVEVEPRLQLRFSPVGLVLRGAPGSAVSGGFTLFNTGNVAFEVRRIYAFGVFDVDGLDNAFGQTFRARMQPGERRIDRFAEALAEGVIEPPAVGEVIMREARRLERLVRDLLDLARLNQQTFTVGRQTVDLTEIAREAVVRYEGQARTLGVSLAVRGSSEAQVEADPDRVLQVLSNLIENALRCTLSGGLVTVTAARGSVVVEDTGPGLNGDDLPRAFERFYLYDRHRTNRSVGTGLGLAIVKELTEAMRGSVTVESSPGRGARFTVTLPVASAAPQRAAPTRSAE